MGCCSIYCRISSGFFARFPRSINFRKPINLNLTFSCQLTLAVRILFQFCRINVRKYDDDPCNILAKTVNLSCDEVSIHFLLLSSLGLVFWELARRTKSLDGCVEDYAQPYFEVVDADPTLDDMRRAVCDKGFRPTVPDRWQETEVIHSSDQICASRVA